jgi:hypothetical protein
MVGKSKGEEIISWCMRNDFILDGKANGFSKREVAVPV